MEHCTANSLIEIFNFGNSGLLLSTDLILLAVVILVPSVLLYRRYKWLPKAGIGLVLILTFLSLSFSDFYILDGKKCAEKGFEPVNGSLSLVSYNADDQISRLKVSKSSARKSVQLGVRVNGEKWREYNLTGKREIYLPTTKKRRNRIDLKANSCSGFSENRLEDGCPAFNLKSHSRISAGNFSGPILEGFYSDKIDKNSWMKKEARIIFHAENNGYVPAVNLTKSLFLNDSDLKASVNGEYVRSSSWEKRVKSIKLVNSSVAEGFNYMDLETADCVVTSEVDNRSNDDRCLSYRLENLSLISQEDIPNPMLLEGWYNEENGSWMGERSEILVQTDNMNSVLELYLIAYKELEGNEIKVKADGDTLQSIDLDNHREVKVPLEGRSGYTKIELVSEEGCRVPYKTSNSSDRRCISVFLKDVNVSAIEGKSRYMSGWYGPEPGGFRWMKNNSYLLYNSSGEEVLEISGQRYEGLENSSLTIFAGGKKISELENLNGAKKIPLNTRKGITVIKMKSEKGCVVPSEVENSTDDRCLSFRFDELDIQQKIYGEGWYEREEVNSFIYRWMSEESSLKFSSNGGKKQLRLEFKPYKHLSDPTLEVYLNGEQSGVLELRNRGRVRESVEINTNIGINNLTFRSSNGCKIPSESERFARDGRCLSFQFNNLEIK